MNFKDKKEDKHTHELEQQIEQLTAEKQEMLDKLQRLSADYINYQKRVPRQIADSVAYEKRAILRSLLPSMDNFEHALAGVSAAQGPEALEKTVKGIQHVVDHMHGAFKAHGVERIVSVGQPFDPERHEAIMQRSEPDKENGIVLEEYLPCYMLGGDLLRPAKVIVNRLPETAPAEPDTTPIEETTDTEPEVQ